MDCVMDREAVERLVDVVKGGKLARLNLCFTNVDHEGMVRIEKAVGGNKKLSLNMQTRPEEDEMVSWFGRNYLGSETRQYCNNQGYGERSGYENNKLISTTVW